MSPTRQQSKALRAKAQPLKASVEAKTDLGGRLVELCEVLGDDPRTFTARFGRSRKQFYKWGKGDQLPPISVLKWAADRERWPLEIFEQGGKRPKELVNRLLNRRMVEPTAPAYVGGSEVLTGQQIDRLLDYLDGAFEGIRTRIREMRPAPISVASAEEIVRVVGVGAHPERHQPQPLGQDPQAGAGRS